MSIPSVRVVLFLGLMILGAVSSPAGATEVSSQRRDVMVIKSCVSLNSKKAAFMEAYFNVNESEKPLYDYLILSIIDPAYVGIEEAAEFRLAIPQGEVAKNLRAGLELKSDIRAYGDAKVVVLGNKLKVSIANLYPNQGEPAEIKFLCKLAKSALN